MSFAQFIQNHLLQRVREREVLVVYDPEERYAAPALALAEHGCHVVDGRGGPLRSRLEAQRALQSLATLEQGDGRLVVLAPHPRPLTPEACTADPYQAFAQAGASFPAGAADSLLELALRAKPGREDEVRALFAGDTSPDFALIDALDDGPAYPRLRHLLDGEGPRDLLLTLLRMPREAARALGKDPGWIEEYRGLCTEQLGFTTAATTSEAVQHELARFVLFSEFVFDQPTPLPAALEAVPRAAPDREGLVGRLCKTWREQDDASYRRVARLVSEELNLERHYRGVTDFGRCDTFPFEEGAYLAEFARALSGGDHKKAHQVLTERETSIWALERRQAWRLAETAYALAEQLQRPAAAPALAEALDDYASEGYRIDQLARELDTGTRLPPDGYAVLEHAIEGVRSTLASYLDARQQHLTGLVAREGWPVSDRLAQTQVFERRVAPHLASHGTRVAYVLVDALRYELGEVLLRLLRGANLHGAGLVAEIEAATAVLPTATPFGMAALMPGATGAFSVGSDGKVRLGDREVMERSGRMGWLRQHYGDRFGELDFEAIFGKKKLPDVQLLVVTHKELDASGHARGFGVLDDIGRLLERLVAGVRRLMEGGFGKVVLTADHGFLLRQELPGDKITPPTGEWTFEKDRARLGVGSPADTLLKLSPATSGTPGGYEMLVVPRTLGTFRAGADFRHGGLSWQEAVIPVITADAPVQAAGRDIEVTLAYKDGATDRITTRRPVVTLGVRGANLLDQEPLVLRVEALSGSVRIGAPTGAYYDAAADVVPVMPGSELKLVLALDVAFEGPFSIVAFDPDTQLVYARLDLRTDYL